MLSCTPYLIIIKTLHLHYLLLSTLLRKKLNPFFLLIFLVHSLSAQEEIQLRGNLQIINSGSPNPSILNRTDFEFANIGGGSKTYTFVIENIGNAPLMINSINLTGDFSLSSPLSPSSPILPGNQANFSIQFTPTLVGLRSATVSIDNSDSDESLYTFAIQGIGVNSSMSSWDPLLYPPSSCSWASQDNNTINAPYASWNLAVADIATGSTNTIISLQPDAYVGSYDYDNQNGNESCVGHQVATTLNADATQNGLSILGSLNGCMTLMDLSSGAAAVQWGNFDNMTGLTIRNIHLKGWGGAITINNCSNVLIEDCVFENSNNVAAEVIALSTSQNVVFRRCSFLGNINPAGRAVRIDNSGTSSNRILFDDCNFGCNSSNAEGAAMLIGAGSFVQINGGVFSGNQTTASGKGGAIFIAVGGDLIAQGSKFIQNVASSSISTEGGGAIYVDGNSNTTATTVLLDACHFYENKTNGFGRGGALVCRGNSSAVNQSYSRIENCIFERNGADRGGAVLAINARVDLSNSIFIANQNAALNGSNSRGGALYYQNSAGNYSINNNTFAGNLSSSGQIGRNATGCGTCFVSIADNNYNGQSHVSLVNTGSSVGANISFSSLASEAGNYDCSSGSYCAFTVSGSCLSSNLSNFICSPSPANSANLSGQVWEDAEGDGIQQISDLGIIDVFVLLYDESGYLIGRTTTDANGFYQFNNLLPDNYRVVFINPDIMRYPLASPANATGSAENTDSDQAFLTYINGQLRGATSPYISLSATSAVTDVDLGLTDIFLPIQLIYFKGFSTGNTHQLSWTTATELNNNYFAVMRSVDGTIWEEIGQLEGNGNSSIEQHYSFEDEFPLQGLNYYRLQQYDINGDFSFSNVIAIDNIEYIKQLYPNPVKEVLYLKLPLESNAEFWISDIQGKTKSTLTNHRLGYIFINVQHLAAGVYILNEKNKTGRTQQLFIKE